MKSSLRFAVLLLLLLGSLSIPLRAQPENQKLLEVGGLVGVNLSKLSTASRDLTTYTQAGYLVGGLLRVNIGNLYLQPELLFSAKGSQLKGTGGNRVQVDFKCIEVPMLMGFKIFNQRRYNVRVMGGPVAAYAGSIRGDDTFQNPDEYFERAQWNAQLGAGVDVMFLTLDMRYEWGLNDLRKQFAEERGFDKPVTTRNLRISVGIKF
jgi:hypothetical protein